MHLVTLVAPTSTERLDKILENQKGFIYCVSSLGVTGARDSFPDELKGFMGKVAQKTSVPRAIGFGISTPEQAAELKKYCEGIIVGSAIVKRIEEGIETGGIDESCRIICRRVKRGIVTMHFSQCTYQDRYYPP